MFRALLPLVASAAAFPAAAVAGELWVNIDSATRHQMPDGVGQVILTNPGVADVEVVSANELMVFGRMPGFTDVVFRTPDGERLSEVRVRVGNERAGLVTLYNGGTRYSFSCTDRCEQTLVVGDGQLADAIRLVGQAQSKLAAGQQQGGLSGEATEVARPGADETAGSGSPES